MCVDVCRECVWLLVCISVSVPVCECGLWSMCNQYVYVMCMSVCIYVCVWTVSAGQWVGGRVSVYQYDCVCVCVCVNSCQLTQLSRLWRCQMTHPLISNHL